MPFTSETATGRPKGSEGKDTKRVREAIAAITEGSVDSLNECFAEIREENPAKFVELYLRLLEYTMPKLRSIDTNIELGDNTVEKVTININAKRTDNTINNGIPGELAS